MSPRKQYLRVLCGRKAKNSTNVFNGEQDRLLQAYLTEMGRYALINGREGEVEIFQRLEKAGGAERTGLIHEIACRNLRLVVAFAVAFHNRGVALMDLIQQGNLGLLKAIERFDYTRGVRFSSYAAWWIKQAMKQETNTHSSQRPYGLNNMASEGINRVFNGQKKFLNQYGRQPTPEELHEQLRQFDEARGVKPLSLRTVTNGLVVSRRSFLSIDAPIHRSNSNGGDRPIILLNIIPDSRARTDLAAMARDRYAHLSAIVDNIKSVMDKKMPPRDKEIMNRRFGLCGEMETLNAIGDHLGLSRERIRQIEKRGYRCLKINLGLSVMDIIQTITWWKTLKEALEVASPDSLAALGR